MKKIIILFAIIFQIGYSQVSLTATSGTTSGSYSTLKATFDAINAGTHNGAITILINADITETATADITFSGNANANYTSILIKPNGGAARTISGNLADDGLIYFSGANNVTIDGLNTGGNSLTIQNQNTNGTTIKLTGHVYDHRADSNTITNCTILGSNTATSYGTNNGVIFLTHGADRVTISNNNIGPYLTNYPAYLIFSEGIFSSHTNDYCIVTGNNFYNYGSAAATSNAAVYVYRYSSNWNISNNKIYQTTTRSFTVGLTYYGIYIGDGSGHTIDNNIIGYANSSGTGTTTLNIGSSNGVGSHNFYPIYLRISSAILCTINSNTIKNINIIGGDKNVQLYLIYAEGYTQNDAITRNVNISSNTIGSVDDPNSIVINTTGTIGFRAIMVGTNTGSAYLYSSTISSNTICGINTSSSTTPTSTDFSILRISGKTGSAFTVNSNTIGYQTAPIKVGYTSSANDLQFIGIFYRSPSTSATGQATITNNIIRYLTSYGTNISSGSMGIYLYNSASVECIVSNNKLYNLVGYKDLIGINTTQDTDGSTFSNNEVYNLTAEKDCTGLYICNKNSVIERNFITRLKTNSTSNTNFIYGIRMLWNSNLSLNTVKNNIISLGYDADGNTIGYNTSIVGIYDFYTGSNYYFNTSIIGGTGSSGSLGSYAFYRWDQNKSTVIRNNTFINFRGNSGSATGSHCAIGLDNGSSLTLNNNNYFVNGTGGVVGDYAGTAKNTLSDWATSTTQDANSISVNPNFIDAVGDSARDYKVANNSLVAGSTISGITTDFSGFTRPSTPTIGALEFTNNHAMPVELKNFIARTQNNNVILNWKTITETNNSGFEVERSSRQTTQATVLRNWEKVTFVRGSGTSSVEREYNYTDNNLRNGKYSYRLKQIDLDGTTEYSQVIEVEVGSRNKGLRTNPNPFNSTTVINYEVEEKTEVSIKLYDLLGRVVSEIITDELKEVGEHEVKFNANHLTSGVYLLKFQTNKNSVIEKLVLMK